MKNGEFRPKAFYRNLDSLLVKIGEVADPGEILSLVLEELVKSFRPELHIDSGCIYKSRFGAFHLAKGPVGKPDGDWPSYMQKSGETFSLLEQHKSYIFVENVIPPWGGNSVAVLVGEDDRYMLVFRLGEGWVRETLEFSLNTIRNTLNYSISASRFNADMQEAYEIQKSLLPRKAPRFEGYDIAGRFVPAERVGGDLYDFSVLDEEVLNFAIGDASGHGLPAALLARDVLTGLRVGIEKEMKISGTIKKLNRVINKSRLSTRFISLVYGELDHDGTLVYVNAGHPPPFILKENGFVELTIGGTILGPLEDTVFKRGFAFLDPGDILALFTDGIVEVRSGDDEMFGTERLKELIKKNRLEPAEAIIGNLFDRITGFGNSKRLQDDATIIIIKRAF